MSALSAAPLPASSPPRPRLLRLALALIPLGLLGLAARALHRELAQLPVDAVREAMGRIGPPALGLALGLTALNYLLLTGYDVLALANLGRRLRYRRVALASFLAYAFGHSVGMAWLSGGSLRYRFYSAWGLKSRQVAGIVAFCSLTFWVGVLATGAWALLSGAAPALPFAALTPALLRAVGVGLAALLLAYLAASALLPRPLELRGHALLLPSLPLALAQVAVASADWVLAAAVLRALLPPEAGLSLAALLSLFIVAQLAGLLSQVPGGLGVFESVVLAALAPRLGAPAVLGTLVVYRLVYYVLPFAAASALLAGHEALEGRTLLSRTLARVHAAVAPLVPTLAALAAFLGGAVLLFSGATPAVHARLQVLEQRVPLAVLEASHVLGSLVGLALLLLARALYRRLDGAWALALGLLVAGGVLSLAKGFDYEEASLLFALALALAPFHRSFHRQTSLWAERLRPGWALAVALVVGASVGLSLFCFRHVEYGHELWWHFALLSDAPRSLRASVGVLGAGFLFGMWQLLQPAPARVQLPDAAALARARPLVARAGEAAAHLALVGDKALLFGERDEALLMYGVEGRSWVAMGDPVGPDAAATQLAWRFREEVDRHHGWCCFYQVGPRALPRYLDLGLSLLKLGEEAVVPLADFSLEGPSRRALRTAHRKMEREGLRFELVPREGVPALLPALQRVSDAWLCGQRTREKGFSLGYFCPRYLAEGPVAVARKDGELVAFANVWAPAERGELSVDLMRHLPHAPRGCMEFLFVELMLWGRAQGYARFNLGMAPFSGLEGHALAPLWHRLGNLLFQHGEHFYNFQGLRQYKEKFDPVWTPRYLAYPGALALPRVLTHVAALVSRGLSGVVAR
ncbi:bifunctional lysylphosphatidylglycerol flippase/synthetase MprF [Aggregicoccus sp. 17bor-14]|uniref:bifunctional lysylphosphatidylglycerol flippase/synthetase MprF n=1 Tax=Myxococcaceae TaxID=31 RepID=UPI00129C7A62|nr:MULTISPECIES: bifunctional lysylphosphatidylglycerol flippase/synthetase MprF [Myxococcaceae]MBF5045975.1 bifunctional lysylphosphatidylglycerol flippase/synthetase MprF [Simulacricoccus sp. 17bor-14]MRI91707.1 bifunctional lysylphosphatidylglycerol flippase/synthetase MprF [Aggregicoccus sp. 17bor-14]